MLVLPVLSFSSRILNNRANQRQKTYSLPHHIILSALVLFVWLSLCQHTVCRLCIIGRSKIQVHLASSFWSWAETPAASKLRELSNTTTHHHLTINEAQHIQPHSSTGQSNLWESLRPFSESRTYANLHVNPCLIPVSPTDHRSIYKRPVALPRFS